MRFSVHISGKSNGVPCASFISIQAKNEELAKKMALNECQLHQPKIINVISESADYAKNLPF